MLNSMSCVSLMVLQSDDIHSLGQTGAIVFNLMENFLGKGYQLYTDNFCNLFELVKYMLK